MELIQEKQKKTFKELGKELGWKNVMQTPKIGKVVISVGVGKMAKDKHKVELVADRLAKITGQKASPRAAKTSIASFKLREGEIIGYAVTLRGARMYGFLDKFIHSALPRTKDFKGVPFTGIDEVGNLTIGIKEHTIFPETADEEQKDILGLAVTIVTTAKNRVEARLLFDAMGISFKKEVKK